MYIYIYIEREKHTYVIIVYYIYISVYMYTWMQGFACVSLRGGRGWGGDLFLITVHIPFIILYTKHIKT